MSPSHPLQNQRGCSKSFDDGQMAIYGHTAGVIYSSLYRLHLLDVQGWPGGTARLVTAHLGRLGRRRIKLH